MQCACSKIAAISIRFKLKTNPIYSDFMCGFLSFVALHLLLTTTMIQNKKSSDGPGEYIFKDSCYK